MTLTRRQLLATGGGALTAPALLAGCGGFSTGGSDTDTPADTIAFTTWGTDAELAGLRATVADFEAANPGSTVQLNAVPYEQMFTNIDAQLQAGNPPDIFRVPYYTFGSYAGRGQLLDLTPHLEDGFADRFTPQAWAAVQSGAAPFGVPHHTDTSVILYDVAALADAGVEVPTSVADTWSWAEFGEAATRLRDSLPQNRYPFAANWQGNGVTRWLSWLFEADGRFLSPDLSAPAIDAEPARSAVDFTRSFFTEGWVPANNSVRSTTYAADTFYSGVSAMVFGGAFMLPEAESTLDIEWGATYPPREVRSASDFGGNALVATAQTAQPELAAAFLAFVTEREQMERFCNGASLLPTRADLVADGISFDVRPELSEVFVAQAGTVLAEDSAQVASPDMSAIIGVLQAQLENAFTTEAATEELVTAMASGIGEAIR